MLMKFMKLPSFESDPWIRLKCFYNEDGKYGEFFLNINPSKSLVMIQSKDAGYKAVLADAFAKAMQEF